MDSKLARVNQVQFSGEEFSTSSFTKPKHDCVEVASREGVVAVRDSKLDNESPQLRFTESEWKAFIAGVKNGEFG